MAKKWWILLCVGGVAIVAVELHRRLLVSWIVLGKVGVYALVPLIMAGFGNYLAAETTKSNSEKRLWRFLFFTVAVVGVAGSLLLEIQLEHDHNNELAHLQIGIKGDMTEALVNYNKQNPNSQITLEQFAALIKPLSPSSGSTAPNTPRTTQNANTVDRLSLALGAVPRVVVELKEWKALKGEEQNINNRFYDFQAHYRIQHPGDANGLKDIENQRQAALDRAETLYGSDAMKKVVKEAQSLQSELLEHVSITDTDVTEQREFARTLQHPDARRLDLMDLPSAGNYLENLADRVRSANLLRFANLTNAMLSDEVAADVATLNELATEWHYDHDEENRRINEHAVTHGTNAEKKEAWDAWLKRERELNAEWARKSKTIILRADDCRLAVLDRLVPLDRDHVEHSKESESFGRLLGGADADYQAVWQAAQYLQMIGKMLPK